MPTLTDEQKLAEVLRIYRSLPGIPQFQNPDDATMLWLSDARAILNLVVVKIDKEVKAIEVATATDPNTHYREIRQKFMDVIAKLRMNTRTVSASIGQGNVFDYYDETRKIIETAKDEIFLIDSYVNAEIVSTYFR